MRQIFFLTNADNHRKVVQEWMRRIISDGGVERLDDLHIDVIDKEWRDRKHWLPAALKSFDLAIEIRDANRFPFDVALAISLKSSAAYKGINFTDSSSLVKEFDWIPPSLYLFQRQQRPWQTPTSPDVTALDRTILGSTIPANECHYLEFKKEAEEGYQRSLVLIG